MGKGACEESGITTGPAWELALRAKNAEVKQALGSIAVLIDSPGAFVILPSSPGTRATLTMLSTGNAVFSVRLTFEDLSTVTIVVCGLWLQEHDFDNRVTQVEVKGSGQVAYLIAGGLA